jgi:hypothetical protein
MPKSEQKNVIRKYVISARIDIVRNNVIHGPQSKRVFAQVRNTNGSMPHATTLAKLHHIEGREIEISL